MRLDGQASGGPRQGSDGRHRRVRRGGWFRRDAAADMLCRFVRNLRMERNAITADVRGPQAWPDSISRDSSGS